MNDKYAHQMKKGVLDMLVLRLLEKEPKYGYQLITELKEKSGNVFVLKEGTLYPILYRLEDEHLVESKWSEPCGKQTARKYYRITETGREALPRITEVWNTISQSINDIMQDET